MIYLTPAQAKERGQFGLAATIRLINNFNLLPEGLLLSHLVPALRFSGISPFNSHPLNLIEFQSTAQILFKAKEILPHVELEIAALILFLINYIPTDESVTFSDRITIQNDLVVAIQPSDIEELKDLLEGIKNELGLASTNIATSRLESTDALKDTTAMRFLKDNSIVTDELLNEISFISGLDREQFQNISKKLVLLGAKRDSAAKALFALTLSQHADDVTTELRLEVISKLYRSFERDDLKDLALEISEKISMAGFRSVYEIEDN